jgi:predicted transcriptional regulator
MRKTTVYLDDEEAEALRKLAASTGVSQAELIRKAIRHAVASVPAREFRSLGLGQGNGERDLRWSAAELYDKAFGRSETT